MASLIKLIREDLRRKKQTSAQLQLQDTLADIIANPGKFAVASSLTDSRTWLHFSCQLSSVEAVELLLKHGADANARDLTERTPLHHACYSRNTNAGKVVELLLRAGAQPNALDCMGYSPLHMACMQENVEAIKALGASKADFNCAGPSGFTGLHLLCQSDTSLDCIDAMLAHGANVHTYDECNRSPVDIARERGTFKAMRRLHEAHREWGEVKYLFQHEAKSVGQDIGRQKLDLRSSIAKIMSAVATGKAPDGADWTTQRPSTKPVVTNAVQRRRERGLPTENVKAMSGFGRATKSRVRGKNMTGDPGTLFDAAEDARLIASQKVAVSDDEDSDDGGAHARRHPSRRHGAGSAGAGHGGGAGGRGRTLKAVPSAAESVGTVWEYGQKAGEGTFYGRSGRAGAALGDGHDESKGGEY